MSILTSLKAARDGVRNLGDTIVACAELVTGAALSLITGRFVPQLADGAAHRASLIICPSPLLNQQRINWLARDQYVISFVNSACQSPVYLTLKPERFFLIDPAFFLSANAEPRLAALASGTERTIARISDATDWPMIIFVPWHYRNSSTARRLSANPNVSVCGIPVFSARGRHRQLKNLAFRLGVANPVYQNVLIAAIFYSLKAGHKRVYVWGAHHTWLRDVEVDSQNCVLHSVRHTESQRDGLPLLNADGSPKRYHVYLKQLATVFEQYHVLQDFACRDGKRIINATAESFIDAFAKEEIIDLFTLGEQDQNRPK